MATDDGAAIVVKLDDLLHAPPPLMAFFDQVWP